MLKKKQRKWNKAEAKSVSNKNLKTIQKQKSQTIRSGFFYAVKVGNYSLLNF